MIKKVDLGSAHSREVFAEPTPLGLIGLALGCAALTPIAFGQSLSPAGLKTAAIFCLLFGGGCQLVAGLMNFANKNLFGGTILAAFSCNWFLNYWALDALASGFVPDHGVLFVTDVVSLIIFVVITYGFGFFSKLLFFFLLDIDLMYLCKVIKALTATKHLDPVIAVLTIVLGALALWIAFAALINPTAGRAIFRIPGPMFAAHKPAGFDFSLRATVFSVLYDHWKERAFEPMPREQLEEKIRAKLGDRNVVPDLFYLAEFGAVSLDYDTSNPDQAAIRGARLTASGIDLHEQLVLKKYGI